ncbi:MAG: thioredoxin family protein, partial [Armatimonadota bacterium]
LLLGFFLFFAMSLGLGVPYLFLAAFSGSIDRLQRSGMWMVWVKKVFAVVLLGVAAYFVKPIVGPIAFHIVLATLAAAGGVYLGLIYRVGGAGAGFRWVRVGFVVAALATAVYLGRAALPKPSLEWEPYTETAVAAAAQDERPVMIYFTAEWCLPCDELKRRTFANERVRAGAQRFVRLKVDLTHETPEAARKYRVVGPPTVVFIDRSGQEREGLRIEGFVGPDAFLSRMREAAR